MFSFVTNKILPCNSSDFRQSITLFVEGDSDTGASSIILTSESFNFAERAIFNAFDFIFLFRDFLIFLGCGPCATPPPTIIGDLLDPTLALPLPF